MLMTLYQKSLGYMDKVQSPVDRNADSLQLLLTQETIINIELSAYLERVFFCRSNLDH